MAGISPIGWVGDGLTSGLTSGVNYLGGAALDRLGDIDPTALTSSFPGAAGTDPMLMMLMQMLMGLMGNSASTGMIDPASQQSLSDLIGGGGADLSGGASSLGGGGGPVGGGGGGGGSSISGGGGGGGGGSVSGGSRTSSYSGPVPDSGPVAPGTAALLKDAGKMVGLNENSDTARIMKVTGESGINPSTTPWCAAFAINMMKDHGVLDTKGLSNPNYCPTVKSWAQDKGIWGESGKYKPKPGDAIMFDWNGDGTDDHIGIVESVKNGKVYTIEGNSSDSVKRNTYDLGDSNIDGYVVSKDATGKDKKNTAVEGSKSAAKGKPPTHTTPTKTAKAPVPKAKAGPTHSSTTAPKAQPATADA